MLVFKAFSLLEEEFGRKFYKIGLKPTMHHEVGNVYPPMAVGVAM
jgi:hypothetical protein